MGIEITNSELQDWIFDIEEFIPAIEPDELTAEMAADKLKVITRRAYEILTDGVRKGLITRRKVRLPNGRKITAYRKKENSYVR